MNRKIMSKILAGTLTALLSANIIGCTAEEAGIETSASEEDYNVPIPVTYITEMEHLQRGCFYVETEDGYALPYFGDITFDTDSYSSSKPSKVAWFSDYDWTAIPTIYEGDHVVFRTNQELSETFYFERFLDIGYTIGISNMEETKTGRYKISIDSDTRAQLRPNSDAFRLIDLGENAVIIDAIGGTPLRSSLVSECGTITNLTKNKSYACDVYVGTEIQPYEIIADSRALYSGQVNMVHDYEFVQAEIIEIEIPDYFNSGYYSVNGSGIFRYVKGTHYTEETDFNILNPASQEEADKLKDVSANKMEAIEYIDILADGTYKILFSYDEEINKQLITDGRTVDEIEAPTVSINVGDQIIKLEKEERANRILAAEITVEVGSYPLQISDIYGREYSIDIEHITSNVTQTNTDLEATSDSSTTPDNSVESTETSEPADSSTAPTTQTP